MKKKNSTKAGAVAAQAKVILQEFKQRLEEIRQEALTLIGAHEQKKISAVRQGIKNIIA